MLLLIVGLITGFLLFSKTPRLKSAAESGASVRACVDGKRVNAFVKED